MKLKAKYYTARNNAGEKCFLTQNVWELGIDYEVISESDRYLVNTSGKCTYNEELSINKNKLREFNPMTDLEFPE